MSKTYFGVDLSEHNGDVDFSKLAKKVDFAILRIGWVGNGKYKLDEKFKNNYSAARKAGIKLGAYVYMYSKSADAAKDGASWVLKQLKGCDFDLPVYCDMEDSSISALGKSKLTAITDAFNSVLKKGDYTVGIYANLDWFKNKLDSSVKKNYHSWIAHYTSGTDKYKGEYEMWQNSSSGKVSGVSGNVDTNYLYADIFKKKKKAAQSVVYFPKYPGKSTSIVDALNSLHFDSSFAYRKKIAKKNGINAYVGAPKQNTKMLTLLKNGKLLRP